jgi:hypothetical protein
MSSILYYSNFCEHSKKLLQTISKTNLVKDIHFICIDKRIKDVNNKTHIVLENGQKIIMPENVNRVPALLLLNKGYEVLYGEAIINFFKPQQQEQVKQATFNNLEPMAFSLSGGNYGIISDQFSFLDMNEEALAAKGNGGIRQMHNYVDIQYTDKISSNPEELEYKGANKISQDLTVEQLQQQRENELHKINGNGQRPV